MQNKPDSGIDQYISGFPENVQAILVKLRQAIHEAAPDAQEVISYGLPAFKQNGNLVYFGAFKKHIGFFPTPSGIKAFTQDLAPYAQSKGAIRFPLDKPIPLELIKKIVKFKVNEALQKDQA
jgi:uncharacterized protein YdhG (YjbR/CyaY superfamily)